MLTTIRKTINYPAFNNFITFVILLQPAVLVLETIPELTEYYLIFEIISLMVLVIYIAEVCLKDCCLLPSLFNLFQEWLEYFGFFNNCSLSAAP